jgi:hypothetical protein
MKWDHARDLRGKFVAMLWVAQEILKLLVPNPSWNRMEDRSSIRELRWDDEKRLAYETTENNKLFITEPPRKTSVRRRPSILSVSTRSSPSPAKSFSIPDETESIQEKERTRSWGVGKEGRKTWGFSFNSTPNKEKTKSSHRILKIGLGCLGGIWCLIGC